MQDTDIKHHNITLQHDIFKFMNHDIRNVG